MKAGGGYILAPAGQVPGMEDLWVMVPLLLWGASRGVASPRGGQTPGTPKSKGRKPACTSCPGRLCPQVCPFLLHVFCAALKSVESHVEALPGF